MNGADIGVIVIGMITIGVTLKLALASVTGCYCDLQLDDLVSKEDCTLGIYKGKRGNIEVEYVKVLITGDIPQSVNVLVDRLGNTYTKLQCVLLSLSLIICLILCAILLTYKYYFLLVL